VTKKLLALSLALAPVLAPGCGSGKEQGLAAEGRRIASSRGCVSCHTTDGSKGPGPTWRGLYGSTVILDDGKQLTANEAYLRESMLQPSAKTVKGFEKGLMETTIRPNSLSDKEVKALIEYIKTLK
jgi:cytochrome c oxidase subunit II